MIMILILEDAADNWNKYFPIGVSERLHLL